MFSDRRRRFKNAVLGVLGTLLAALSIGIYGYMLSGEQNRVITPEDAQKTTAISTPQPVQTIAPANALLGNARVLIRTEFTKCGHTVEEDKSSTALEDLIKEELLVRFPGTEVEYFAPDRAVLKRKENGYCQAHYMLKYENGSLKVYRPENSGQTWNLVQDIGAVQIYEGTDALEQGVIFDSMEQIESYLENLDS